MMTSNTALTDPTATKMDNMQLWVDLQAEMHNAKTTPDYDDAVRRLDAVEAKLETEQRDKEWQTDLAEAEAQDAEAAADGEIPSHQLGVIDTEINRARDREGQLWTKLDEIRYSEGARDCDRAVRRAAAIEAEIDRVQARQAELATLRVATEDAADDYGPGANYDANDVALN